MKYCEVLGGGILVLFLLPILLLNFLFLHSVHSFQWDKYFTCKMITPVSIENDIMCGQYEHHLRVSDCMDVNLHSNV